MIETRRDGPEKSLLQLRAAGEREEGELEKAQEKELCTKPGSRPGLCPPRGQAIKYEYETESTFSLLTIFTLHAWSPNYVFSLPDLQHLK